MQTDKNSVIGGYMPEEWEDTTDKERGIPSCKNIFSGTPFLFFFLDDQIQIINHIYGKIPYLASDKDWLMVFGEGLKISADQNEMSLA